MKNVLITGGSRGIGAAAVREFSKAGCRVFFTYRSSHEEAERLEAECGAKAIRADMESVFDCKKAAEEVNFCGGADILILNAGISGFSLFQDISESEWDRMFNINTKAPFVFTKAALPSMINKKSGSIIFVSSVWGISGASCEAHYAASKAALIGLTKSLAKELAPSGINVNCIAPGVIDTDMNGRLCEKEREELKAQIPKGRYGRAEEIAQIMLFLSSQKASYITGQTINADGGLII